MVLKNQKGQTVVEYILLLAVVLSLVVTFYNSKAFQRIFGEQGQLGESIKNNSEFGYRHAFPRGSDGLNQPDYPGISHPSYYDAKNGTTRFFGPRDPYN